MAGTEIEDLADEPGPEGDHTQDVRLARRGRVEHGHDIDAEGSNHFRTAATVERP